MTFPLLKQVSVLLGVVALSSLLPATVLAKPQTTSTPQTTSATGSLAEQLNLSAQQKNKIRGIYASRTRQIDQVLTPQQKEKFQAERKSGKKTSEALNSLNLNGDQKKKILAIIQKTNQDIRASLDNNQQQKLDAYLRQRRQNSQQAAIE